jgi:hypothetical protein
LMYRHLTYTHNIPTHIIIHEPDKLLMNRTCIN